MAVFDCLVPDTPRLGLVSGKHPGIEKSSNGDHLARTQVYRIDLHTPLVHNPGLEEILYSDTSEICFKGRGKAFQFISLGVLFSWDLMDR